MIPGNTVVWFVPSVIMMRLVAGIFTDLLAVLKMMGFDPFCFPDPKDPCVKHKPYKVNLPHFMTWIQPWSDFTSGKIRIITNDGTSFSFYPYRMYINMQGMRIFRRLFYGLSLPYFLCFYRLYFYIYDFIRNE